MGNWVLRWEMKLHWTRFEIFDLFLKYAKFFIFEIQNLLFGILLNKFTALATEMQKLGNLVSEDKPKESEDKPTEM